MNPIVYAIPVFFALIGLELLWARRRGLPVYGFADAVGSISLGTLSQLTGLYSKLVVIGLYALAHEHLRVTDLPIDSAWTWIAGLVLYDFCYYWQHRLSHEVSLLWASHVVHHQSESFNLSTALRQTSTGFLFGWVFYLPMALLGFPPLVFIVVGLIDLLYQYWIHTELVGKLGWFDRVFASPSNHRVHHGVNDRYLDRNYGGILILWDRMFGTFVEESDEEPVVYGTRAPLGTLDPLWANVEVYAALARDSWRTRGWADRLRLWFARPGWRPAELAARYPKAPFEMPRRARFDPPVGARLRLYVATQFALLTAGATACLAWSTSNPDWRELVAVAWLCFSLWSLAALIEGRRWAVLCEWGRHVVLGVALVAVVVSRGV